MLLRNRNLVPEKRPPLRKAFIVIGLGLAVLLALLLRVLIHAFWIFPLEIGTTTMEPDLKRGQVVYVNRRVTIAFGDIVLYRHPNIPDLYLLGRVAGLPGDALRLEDKKLMRNGAASTEAWQR